jgi:uncharacterized pyridoxamine 5'-phosphate oxidase family protein
MNFLRRLKMTRDDVITFIQEIHFGYLATVDADNTPCVRPLGIYNVYGDDVYFFTFSILPKCTEIEANPNVEVVWANLDKISQVRLKGKAVVVEDEDMKKLFIEDNPTVNKVLPPGSEHLFRLYKIQPTKVSVAEGLVPYTEVAWYS